jgi:hemerythrin-like domain-containing protein
MAPLKRHPALVPISREHHQVLVLAQLLKADVPNYRGLPETPEEKRVYTQRFYLEYLKHHLDREDTVLFPLLRGKNSVLDDLMDELVKEHQAIRRRIQGLKDGPDLPADLDSLGHLLSDHVRKEERQFFSKLQEVMVEEDWQVLEKKLSAF